MDKCIYVYSSWSEGSCCNIKINEENFVKIVIMVLICPLHCYNDRCHIQIVGDQSKFWQSLWKRCILVCLSLWEYLSFALGNSCIAHNENPGCPYLQRMFSVTLENFLRYSQKMITTQRWLSTFFLDANKGNIEIQIGFLTRLPRQLVTFIGWSIDNQPMRKYLWQLTDRWIANWQPRIWTLMFNSAVGRTIIYLSISSRAILS